MTVDAGRLEADLVHLEQLVALHTELQATKHSVFTLEQQVWVRVEGAQYEARAWRAAIAGRILGSSIDHGGVRRQMILGERVCVEIFQPGWRPPSELGGIGRGIVFVVAGIGLFLVGLLHAGHHPDMRVVGACAIVGVVVLLLGTGFGRYRRHDQADKASTEKIEGRILPSTSTDHFLDGV